MLVPATAVAVTPVSTFTEGTAAVPFSLLTPISTDLTTGPAGDQALSLTTDGSRQTDTAAAYSASLDLGRAGVDKEFLSISWNAHKIRGADIQISYSVNGGAWLPAVGGQGADLPSGTHGKTIAYRVAFVCADPTLSPVLYDISIEFGRWTGGPSHHPGDGSGTSHHGRSGQRHASGAYTYPGGGSGSGAPSSGAGGPGGGSGSGAGGSGTGGSGSGSLVAGASSSVAPLQTSGSADAAALPGPPSTSAQGPAQTVSGVPTVGAAQVAGTPLKEVSQPGSVGDATAARGTAADKTPFSFPIAMVVAVATVLAVFLLGPWPLVAHQMRCITGYDQRRARYRGPFRRLSN